MMMVAIEPKREVADWLRKRGDQFGLEIEVHPDLERARPRLEQDPVDLLAGYFGSGKAMIPHWPDGGPGIFWTLKTSPHHVVPPVLRRWA